MRATLIVLVAFAALAVASPGGASGPQVCQARSVGPGALARGTTAGAACLLRAYRNGCSPTTYELSSFGVDTIATLRFQLVHGSGGCTIDVSRSFRVVPQKPHVTAVGHCKALRRTAADIVATGCRGTGLSATTSLTR
jgi:hypothetical protein